jgi:hypothetical protein
MIINCKEIQLTAEAAFKNAKTGHPKLKKLEDSNVNKTNDSFIDIIENQFIYK